MSTGKFPEGWVSPQLDEIATDINYGYTASSTSENIGPKMLRITDIQDNKVDWNSVLRDPLIISPKRNHV
ncbi:hypothetical protein [Enterobacter hormaechei]|uniref:hypothetical protein n=1 Tax=Enterobacter hormaechei TaxID=158836 RepID=UPI00186A9A29|nr:hypothetical protein [Enterobacter hormaechei]MDR9883919.1 hypothetical protein [Enterobacter hormaechei subsp. steigerwaltii]